MRLSLPFETTQVINRNDKNATIRLRSNGPVSVNGETVEPNDKGIVDIDLSAEQTSAFRALLGNATALAKARDVLRIRFPDSGERRRALDIALGPGGPLDVLSDIGPDRVQQWLQSARSDPGGGVEITLRSDDPEDLTLREARLLGSADVIAAEAGVPSAVLDRARADAKRIVLGNGIFAEDHPGLVVVLRTARQQA